ncbi:MAG: hypothetical protein ALECFALPRED_002103 [Alectoria fallacina]|uniref:Uncharacterized protein n=1 Tax=Alectoria fallacina TaxID=1903189 RepID=A0A8H3FIE0_9LECA|nr:MAG: hypothetical protein ALECFALPRED_002103 [Alectoria fallacina]
MDQPTAQPVDVEKHAQVSLISPESISLNKRTVSSESSVARSVRVHSKIAQWNTKIESLAGLEARGIARVPLEERHQASVIGYAQMAFLWFSSNVTANNLGVGLLGPLLFNLGFTDSVMMATFGCLLGSAVTAYMSIWSAQSGNRTMVCNYPLIQDFPVFQSGTNQIEVMKMLGNVQ